MKISLDTSYDDRLTGLAITPKSACLNRPRLRSSSSCRVNVKLPSVETEEKTKHIIEKFPLRSTSVLSKRVRKPLLLSNHLFEIDMQEKSKEAKSVKRKVSVRFIRPAYERFLDDSVANIQNFIANVVLPLPDPHLLEHKRATLRLRKLKRVVSSCKENIAVNLMGN